MKKLISFALALALVASCAGPKGTINLDQEGLFSRTAHRVVERCPQDNMDVRTFIDFVDASVGDVSVQIIGPLYDPVEELHDLSVLTDPSLDVLEQEIYIGDTQALRGWLTARGYKRGE